MRVRDGGYQCTVFTHRAKCMNATVLAVSWYDVQISGTVPSSETVLEGLALGTVDVSATNVASSTAAPWETTLTTTWHLFGERANGHRGGYRLQETPEEQWVMRMGCGIKCNASVEWRVGAPCVMPRMKWGRGGRKGRDNSRKCRLCYAEGSASTGGRLDDGRFVIRKTVSSSNPPSCMSLSRDGVRPGVSTT